MDIEEEHQPSRLEDIKYYTSLFLGTVAIISVFAFLFLVPFVLDPAISTLMHKFVDDPVHCRVTRYELNYGLTNCSWSSCREGCTAEFFKCHQLRVTYTPELPWTEGVTEDQIDQEHWARLHRTEKIVIKVGSTTFCDLIS